MLCFDDRRGCAGDMNGKAQLGGDFGNDDRRFAADWLYEILPTEK